MELTAQLAYIYCLGPAMTVRASSLDKVLVNLTGYLLCRVSYPVLFRFFLLGESKSSVDVYGRSWS